MQNNTQKQLELNRENFMATTGVFVTPSYFEIIKLEYANTVISEEQAELIKTIYMEDIKEDSDIFAFHWLANKEACELIEETKDQVLKYCIFDEDISDILSNDSYDNFELDQEDEQRDLLERCSQSLFVSRNNCYKHWGLVHKMLDSGRISKDVADELLVDETISYEQIYQLQSTIVRVINELLDVAV